MFYTDSDFKRIEDSFNAKPYKVFDYHNNAESVPSQAELAEKVKRKEYLSAVFNNCWNSRMSFDTEEEAKEYFDKKVAENKDHKIQGFRYAIQMYESKPNSKKVKKLLSQFFTSGAFIDESKFIIEGEGNFLYFFDEGLQKICFGDFSDQKAYFNLLSIKKVSSGLHYGDLVTNNVFADKFQFVLSLEDIKTKNHFLLQRIKEGKEVLDTFLKVLCSLEKKQEQVQERRRGRRI